jgi:hypothetical protein
MPFRTNRPLYAHELSATFDLGGGMLPLGTPVALIRGLDGRAGDGFVIADVPALVALTGNTHDPHYRYVTIRPADVCCDTPDEEATRLLVGVAWRAVYPPRSPLAGLAPDLRAWLVDEMGMQAEIMGGGATGLRHIGPGGWSILITGADGHLPHADSWHVGVYTPDEGTGCEIDVWNARSDDSLGATASPINLRAAVSMACALVASVNDEPVSPLAVGQNTSAGVPPVDGPAYYLTREQEALFILALCRAGGADNLDLAHALENDTYLCATCAKPDEER